jgi:PleD family two-component response regulator
MESRNREKAARQALKIMVVGNNPIDLSKILTRIQKINDRNVVAEIAFDMQSIMQRLSRFKPDFILLDDNIGRVELKEIVKALRSERTTRQIPITVIKNSNYTEAISDGVIDYMLKETLTGESLYRALLNSLKVRRTQLYLYQSYKQRKGQLMRLFRREPALQI